jgi:hypothetical protein
MSAQKPLRSPILEEALKAPPITQSMIKDEKLTLTKIHKN